MVEQRLAQVVANLLAQDAGEIDEAEHADGLHDDQRAVARHDAAQRGGIPRDDGVVDQLFAQEREVRVEQGSQTDGDQESD